MHITREEEKALWIKEEVTMRGPTGQNEISCKIWKSFSKMSKLILQTLETGFKNPEKEIFENNFL